jgi:poly [ADP-ribose] polymerase
MAEAIETAKTGRAKCRVCRDTIEKGTLRFGEEQPSAFADGMQWVWHHLACAAKKKPVQVRSALAAFEGEVPNRAELEAVLAEADKTASVLPYAEHATTGRSKCLHCHEPIEKGALRVATEREAEPGGMPRGPGYLHPKCAGEFIEADDLLDLLKKNSRGLTDVELAELEGQLVG